MNPETPPSETVETPMIKLFCYLMNNNQLDLAQAIINKDPKMIKAIKKYLDQHMIVGDPMYKQITIDIVKDIKKELLDWMFSD